MKPREIKRLTATLKAIADPTRRAIFDLVWKSEKKESISTITKEFKITRQGITKHLKILSEGDLIELKRIGRVTYVHAHAEALERAENWASTYKPKLQDSKKLGTPADVEEIMSTIKEIEHLAEEIIETVSAETPAPAAEIMDNTDYEEETLPEPEVVSEPVQVYSEELQAAENEVETMLESTDGVALEDTEKIQTEKELIETEKVSAKATEGEELHDEDMDEVELDENGKPQLLQMSIDPNDPGTPVKEEPVKEEPVAKEAKEKPIEVTENQLDIYGVRKEPKLDESNQFELF